MNCCATWTLTYETPGLRIKGAVPLLPRGRPESGLISRRLRAFSLNGAICAMCTLAAARAVYNGEATAAEILGASREPAPGQSPVTTERGRVQRRRRERWPWSAAAGLEFVTTPRLSAIPSQSLRLEVEDRACEPFGCSSDHGTTGHTA